MGNAAPSKPRKAPTDVFQDATEDQENQAGTRERRLSIARWPIEDENKGASGGQMKGMNIDTKIIDKPDPHSSGGQMKKMNIDSNIFTIKKDTYGSEGHMKKMNVDSKIFTIQKDQMTMQNVDSSMFTIKPDPNSEEQASTAADNPDQWRVWLKEEEKTLKKPKVHVPNLLTIKVPINESEESDQLLMVHNKESFPVYYKVKVTHPKLLLFRPVIGRIKPQDSVEITVKLSADRKDLESVADNCKAMIQTIMCGTGKPYEEMTDTSSMWQNYPQPLVGINKLKLVFDYEKNFVLEDDQDMSQFKSYKSPAADPWWKK